MSRPPSGPLCIPALGGEREGWPRPPALLTWLMENPSPHPCPLLGPICLFVKQPWSHPGAMPRGSRGADLADQPLPGGMRAGPVPLCLPELYWLASALVSLRGCRSRGPVGGRGKRPLGVRAAGVGPTPLALLSWAPRPQCQQEEGGQSPGGMTSFQGGQLN